MAVLTLEYRIRVHPNIQFFPLVDAGQVWDRTGELEGDRWHIDYGFGFRVRTAHSTFLRLEFGWGGEGTQFHLVMGDRPQTPLTGGIRYGRYKR